MALVGRLTIVVGVSDATAFQALAPMVASCGFSTRLSWHQDCATGAETVPIVSMDDKEDMGCKGKEEYHQISGRHGGSEKAPVQQICAANIQMLRSQQKKEPRGWKNMGLNRKSPIFYWFLCLGTTIDSTRVV